MASCELKNIFNKINCKDNIIIKKKEQIYNK